eukprot:Hpha_TRINITY_DN14943_c2_g5::TRINITY_DN14943_c2_g5_i1::g.143099::m.143099
MGSGASRAKAPASPLRRVGEVEQCNTEQKFEMWLEGTPIGRVSDMQKYWALHHRESLSRSMPDDSVRLSLSLGGEEEDDSLAKALLPIPRRSILPPSENDSSQQMTDELQSIPTMHESPVMSRSDTDVTRSFNGLSRMSRSAKSRSDNTQRTPDLLQDSIHMHTSDHRARGVGLDLFSPCIPPNLNEASLVGFAGSPLRFGLQ